MKDNLINNVEWKDLLTYQPWETLKELFLPIPWIILALWATSQTWYWLTLPASFYFFLACLRVSHNAFHYALGLSRPATDFVMLVLSIFMMGSMRAIQTTHMQHHRHCLTEKDVEGHVAKQRFWIAILKGPLFTIHLHIAALRISKPKQKFWIKFELLTNIVWLFCVWAWWDSVALQIHTLLMIFSHAVSPFFTVWTVHHDCENKKHTSRTLRAPWLSLLAFNMFYHLEHHLFPAVPTCHLPMLAKRLDANGFSNYQTVL